MSSIDTVRTLLAVAGLTLADDELAEVAAGYSELRSLLDGMFELPVDREEEPDLRLDLTPPTADAGDASPG